MNLQSCSQRLHAKTQSVGSASQRRTCVLISKQVTSLPVYQTPVMREHHIAGTLRPSVRPIVKTVSASRNITHQCILVAFILGCFQQGQWTVLIRNTCFD